MSVTVNFLLFLKPEAELSGRGDTVTSSQLDTLAEDMHQRLTAIAVAADALRQDSWHLSPQGYDPCASHPDVQTATQAQDRLQKLRMDPACASIYAEQDDEEVELLAVNN
jgi:hypothetical protein